MEETFYMTPPSAFVTHSRGFCFRRPKRNREWLHCCIALGFRERFDAVAPLGGGHDQQPAPREGWMFVSEETPSRTFVWPSAVAAAVLT